MSQSLFLLTNRVDAQDSGGWLGTSNRRRFLVPLLIGMVAVAGCQVRKYELAISAHAKSSSKVIHAEPATSKIAAKVEPERRLLFRAIETDAYQIAR